MLAALEDPMLSLSRPHILVLTGLLGLTFALGAAIAEAPAAAPTKGENVELEATVAGIEARYKLVTDFKASFAQEVKRAHNPRPKKKSGRVYFKAPGMMRWDYLSPERVYYISDGEILWSVEKEQKQVAKLNIKDSDLFDSLKFLFGQGDLRASFDATFAGHDGDLVGLSLVPKKGQQNFKSLTVWAKKDGYEVVKTVLIDPVDNVSTITFKDLKYDTLKVEGFKYTPDPNFKLLDYTKQK
ncbi:MAG: outer membrane lipoprotein carrier protein [Myxococcota bacterium]|jgi:outer membrane lipoprotein carrier protein